MIAERVHVVVVNFRSADYLQVCVESLLLSGVGSITIVDNASGDAERSALDQISSQDARIDLILSPSNLGFGAGVNLGVRRSNAIAGDFVWVVNPDTAVELAAAQDLASALAGTHAEIVSPLISTGGPGEESIWFAGGYVDYQKGVSWHVNAGEDLRSITGDLFESSFITGAAPMMTRSTWDQLGGFREDLFLYWEDADLSIRAIAMGMRLAVVPSARIWHEQGGSTGQRGGGHSPGYYYYNQRNRLVVCRQKSSLGQLLAGRGLRETLRLLAKPLLMETAPRWPKFASSLRGIWDGCRGVTGLGPVKGSVVRRRTI